MNAPVSPRRLPGGSPTQAPPRRSRRWWWVAAAVLVVVGGIGLALFEPWRLFTRSSIDEAAPVAAAVPEPGSTASSALSSAAATTTTATTATVTTATVSIAAGSVAPITAASAAFVDGEHATTGTATIVRAADGRRWVRLENFSTSDGPDVHVILSDRSSGQADWGVYDDGRFVELGELKATDGSQNYEIPADVDLSGLHSVVIWCDRFDVAFGTAALNT